MKIEVGVDHGAYTFNAAAKTITLTGLVTINLEQVLIIVNATLGQIIYQFNNPSLKATIAGNVITLNSSVDTSMMTNADRLSILIEYPITLPSVGTTGAAIQTKATQMGGSDGTNLRTFKVDTDGRQYVRNIPNPFSSAPGRFPIKAMLNSQTADQLLYTVTVGRILYLTSIVFGMVNTSTGANGEVILRDGTTAAGTAVIPFLSPTAGAGVLSSEVGNVTTPISFPEPVPITSGVFMDIIAGTINYSIFVSGYEETL